MESGIVYLKRLKESWNLAVIWILLNIFDCAVTTVLLLYGSIEVNPIVGRVIDANLFVQYKLLMSMFVLVILAMVNKLHLLKFLNIGLIGLMLCGIIWGLCIG